MEFFNISRYTPYDNCLKMVDCPAGHEVSCIDIDECASGKHRCDSVS